MEKFKFLLRQARSSFETADHLAYVTYPMVKENKMLFIIVENLYKSCMKLVSAILYYERLYKRIMTIPLEWDARFVLFEKVSRRYGVNSSTVKEVKEIVDKYKESPMTFSRGEKFVIASDRFSMKTLDINLLKKYIIDIRTVLTKLEAISK